MKVCTYPWKEIIAIFYYFNWATDSIIISNYGRYIAALVVFCRRNDLIYTLPYCIGIFFVLLKVMLIVSLFTLPCQFNYFICAFFVWVMFDQFLLLIFCFQSFFFIEVLMPLVIYCLDIILFSLFCTVLIGACLSKILLTKRKKVLKPKFISLFTVINY